ncbi:hypothetical protein ACFFLZ_12880 [Photobacterium aphoticum]|uniref:Uncharacterized protein n=1 Tax=Photobacterium aphoticum TaxID=754436 RepID=A0A0J1GML2_9GAMM|nr:hypothetical protein [Photobacterium aphoticum]KLV00841.1 hypothetical protein ABT58_10500 [Photobacterium aphoticum]PSU55816.1 hypothetical protein C9I90_14830 [Photobacterium aphoticum]GHA52488.1 hypothetical protein GCM10007086_28180 [Photobacterium aphoticum]
MKTLIVKNTLLTLAVCFSIIWLISFGEFLVTASQYPVDYIYLVLGTVLAVLVSAYTVRDLQINAWHKSFGIYFVYYFLVLGLFADGHQAGWSHSDGFLDKLFMSGIYIFVFSFSFIVPIIIGLLAFTQAYFLSIAVENRRI